MCFWCWLAAIVIFGPIIARGFPSGAGLLVVFIAFGAGLLTTVLTIGHFTSHRAFVVPRYREVHLAAMGLTGTALFALSVAWLALWSPVPIWRVTGLFAVAFAVGFISAGPPRVVEWAFVPVFVAAFLLTCFIPRDSDWLQDGLRYAETGWANLIFLPVAGFLLARFARRLWSLDEDDAAYLTLRRQSMLERSDSGMPAAHGLPDELSKARLGQSTPLSVSVSERRLDRTLRQGPGTFAWNVRRWGLAEPDTDRSLVMPGVTLSAAVFIWLLANGRLTPHLPTDWM